MTQIVNVSPDGTLASPPPQCQSVQQSGCTARDSGCALALANGCTGTFTKDDTFAADGSAAMGLETLSAQCPDGSGCTSTYQVSATRQ